VTLYLYGFVPQGTTLPAAGLAGVADAPVELLPAGSVLAAVSRVPADEYAPGAVEARSEDLRWLAQQGVRHEGVIAWFVDHAEILPMRLLTLYSSAAALARDADERGGWIHAQLERFRGLREWDLKIAYDPDRLSAEAGRHSPAIADLDRELAEAQPGRRFLLQRKRRDLVGREVGVVARRLAGELLDRVVPQVDRHVLLPLQAGEPGAAPVVLNAALLVAAPAAADLAREVRTAAAALAEAGMTVSFSGPWAPYRFFGEGDDGRPGAAGGAPPGGAGEPRP
jgi:hypothetical protein